MSKNKQEYDRFRGLLNGEQVATLSSEFIVQSVQAKTLSDLGREVQRLYIVVAPNQTSRKQCRNRKTNLHDLFVA